MKDLLNVLLLSLLLMGWGLMTRANATNIEKQSRFEKWEAEMPGFNGFVTAFQAAEGGTLPPLSSSSIPSDTDKDITAETYLDNLLNSSEKSVILDFVNSQLSHNQDTPIEVDSWQDGLVLKVTSGDGHPVVKIQEVNLSFSGDPGPFSILIGKETTTYLLLKLTEIPSGTSILKITLQEEGNPNPRFWHLLSVNSKPWGHLGVKILDENNQETPALVRLRNKETGRLFDIPSAVDIGPIMSQITGLNIYGPGKGFTYYMPGSFGGQYWVCPGPFELTMTPGEWELVVHHGPEYIPIRETLTVEEKQWTHKTVNLKRWTKMKDLGWYAGDDHVHARLMHSKDADDIMAYTKAADITVANILEMGNAARTWYSQRGFGKEFRVTSGETVLVPGQEDPRTDFGHTISLNINGLARDVENKYMLNSWVADETRRLGGLYGQTHLSQGFLGIHRELTLNAPFGRSDFCSIMQNILGTDYYYDLLDLGFKFTASAGSDTPYGGAIGVTRVYVYTGETSKESPFDVDDWFAALKAGHTFTTHINGPMLEFQVDDHIAGDEILLQKNQPLKIKAKAWGLENESAPRVVEVVCNSRVIFTENNNNPNDSVIELNESYLPENGGWIALRAHGFNGSSAHTSPVYFHRKGYRHWNQQRARELIANRLDILSEIETLINSKKEAFSKKQVNAYDLDAKLIAKQHGEIQSDVEKARASYNELIEVLDWEEKQAD